MAEAMHTKRGRALLNKTGYGSAGGHLGRANGGDADDAEDKGFVRSGVGQHETAMHKGEPKTKLRLQDGGSASGEGSRPRHDRPSRGKGSDKHQPKINIMIHSTPNRDAGAGPPAAPAPPASGPMPPPRPVMAPRPPMAMPPGAGMPPMGAGPGGPLPPGGVAGAGLPPRPMMPPPGAIPPQRPPGMMKRGGAAKGGDMEACAQGGGVGSIGSGTRKMRAGAGSGEGRLEQIGGAKTLDY